jgi:hypothetical protein
VNDVLRIVVERGVLRPSAALTDAAAVVPNDEVPALGEGAGELAEDR